MSKEIVVSPGTNKLVARFRTMSNQELREAWLKTFDYVEITAIGGVATERLVNSELSKEEVTLSTN